MIELLVLMFIIAIITGLGRWATAQRYRRMYEAKRRHDLYYNSLDPNSKYSERKCCGQSCGCHSEEPKETDFKSSGDMQRNNMEYAIGFLSGIVLTMVIFFIYGSIRLKRNKKINEVMDIYSKLQVKSRKKAVTKDNAARVSAMEKAIGLLRGIDETKE